MNGLSQILRKTAIAGLPLVSSFLAVAAPALADMSVQAQQPAHTTQTQAGVKAQSATIAAMASANEALETLTVALGAADLVDLLNGSEEFTVFAPTDEAFSALPEGTVEMLLQPENRDQLVQILTYHVVPGRVLSTDLSEGAVTSAEGSPLDIAISAAGVSVNGVNVIQADVEASNGVIHVIDQVLLP